MEIVGTIEKLFDIQEIGSSGFRKREVVIRTDEAYPQPLIVEFVQDRSTLLDHYQEGQQVKIAINLRGREWTNPEGVVRYFVSIRGWRIDPYTSGASPSSGSGYEQRNAVNNTPTQSGSSSSTSTAAPSTDDDDDLPF